MHRDIKPENIAIKKSSSNKEEIKLLDFGFSSKFNRLSMFEKKQTVGTVYYCSPETFTGYYD